MKTILLAAILSFSFGIAMAQHDNDDNYNEIQTLSGQSHHSGGYGGLLFKSTSFGNETVVMAGVRGAWVINRTLGIGIEANGIIPTAKFSGIDGLQTGEKAILLGGYGGLMIEPVFLSNKLAHLTFPISAGAGWLGYHEDWEDHNEHDIEELLDEDVFWYVEPGVSAELNINKNFRVGLGASYRLLQDLELSNTSSKAFNNMNYSLVLKFGAF